MDGLIRAIKSDSGEWLLQVLGNPWSGQNDGRDSDQEFFDAITKFHEDKFGLPVAVHYHGYDDNGKPSGEPEYVGKSLDRKVDAQGVWYTVALDKTKRRANELWEAAQKGLLRASSGSVAHLVRKVKGNKLVNGLGQVIKQLQPGQYKDGHILEWPNVELSIFSIENGKQPANSYAVAIPMAKAVYDEAGLTLPDSIQDDGTTEPEATAIGAEASVQKTEAAKSDASPANSTYGDQSMNDVQELVQQAVASALKAQAEANEAEQKRQAAIKAQVDSALAEQAKAHEAQLAAAKAEGAAGRRLPGGGDSPYVAKFSDVAKFANLEPADASVMFGILQAAKSARRGEGPSEQLRQYIAISIADSADGKNDVYQPTKTAMKMAGMPMKANELNQSTLATFGDEWIGLTYSNTLWDKIRLATPVVANIPAVEIPQGSESIIFPINSTSPTFYKVAQAADQAANPGRVTPTFLTSKMGTGNRTITAQKMGAAINYTGELEEDSLIPWASQLRADLVSEGAEVLEFVVIDGDTTLSATTNINHIAGTPAATDVYTLFDGFRKLALVTNTANSRSAGVLALDDYLETVKLLGVAGRNAIFKDKVAFIVDVNTRWKTLDLVELKTRDVFSNPTVEGGELVNIYGYNVITSANMHRINQDATYGLRANAAGKVDQGTAANNTTGSILAVRWDQWKLGFKRRWNFEVERDAISDSTNIVAHMRVGMINRDAEASAISYNVTL